MCVQILLIFAPLNKGGNQTRRVSPDTPAIVAVGVYTDCEP